MLFQSPLNSNRHGHIRLVLGFRLERYIPAYADALPSYVDLVVLAAATRIAAPGVLATAIREGSRQLLVALICLDVCSDASQDSVTSLEQHFTIFTEKNLTLESYLPSLSLRRI